MATRHIITMLEQSLRAETEQTSSYLSKTLPKRIMEQAKMTDKNKTYQTIGDWYKNHFLFQQSDFLWAKYAFYDAYCEALQKQGHLTKRVRHILESIARKHGKQYISSVQNWKFPDQQAQGTA
ncbi:hypothetical protein ACRS6Y_15335 [Bacillus cytotoxicus]|uniref:Transposase n=2 Tax=Bacillus cytotoxicus TaxID=580165 RepID=A0AAX2CCM5_9BACI|nr:MULTISPECIES: hypothetical protein [Bacillus cereus group]ABS20693.1 conserved hypothetical protein [Bacillus cytotoxicus NVH 391-98]AWC27326.1 hypothetical protein CG483_002155 [Bacillus cytotoxicus]AWC31362.1 hypothetical protein CG482_002050 [Bacillus cytotoxicus]AWC35401.1 hypothetical protein CG481_002050 [Bacillus cytotoxicus]AWC39439.1 hypothetical protein CG480_002150 [Bacillus cytotoxicus]